MLQRSETVEHVHHDDPRLSGIFSSTFSREVTTLAPRLLGCDTPPLIFPNQVLLDELLAD